MRTRLRKLLIVSVFVLAGPAALLLFSQLSGNLAPLRQVRDRFPVFADVAVDPESNIVAVTDENLLRIIQGPGTGLADPHGIFVDDQNNEIFVANHDSYHDAQASQEESSSVQDQFARGIADLSVPTERLQPRSSNGKFVEPSI